MDVSLIKERLNQLQTTTQTKNSFWKPQPGKSLIRIVPYKHNKENPFIELYFHYNLGDNKTHISPVSFGRKDPINEFADKLKSSGNREEWIQGKRLEPKMRTFVPVVERGNESEGVKFWGFGKTVYQELLSIIADPDYGDISDVLNGRDIGVERQTPAEAGNQFGKTTIRVKPNVSPLTEDKQLLERLFEEQPELTELYPEPSYDDLKTSLHNYLNPEAAEEQESNSQTNESNQVEKAGATAAKVADDFDALFNS
tara:strand:+ start:344 stop:1108 length:765 start_codon:yes stop_codon:yes gene_type:complete